MHLLDQMGGMSGGSSMGGCQEGGMLGWRTLGGRDAGRQRGLLSKIGGRRHGVGEENPILSMHHSPHSISCQGILSPPNLTISSAEARS